MATGKEPPRKSGFECNAVKKVKSYHTFAPDLKQEEKTSCEENTEFLRNTTSYSTSLLANTSEPILPYVSKGITVQPQQKGEVYQCLPVFFFFYFPFAFVINFLLCDVCSQSYYRLFLPHLSLETTDLNWYKMHSYIFIFTVYKTHVFQIYP